MELITVELLTAMGATKEKAKSYADHLQAAANEFGIDTPLEICHWLAQVFHESGKLMWTRELWGPTKSQERYDTRADLGNTPERDGDGYHNRGVGLIQLTGEFNIERALKRLGYPPNSNDNLTTPEGASRSAALFWFDHGLDAAAVRAGKDVRSITRIVNGGYNGLAERQGYFDKAMRYLAALLL
jgi:putative chitinase